MPYITPATRAELHDGIESDAYTPGELNFEITVLIASYITQNGLGYQTLNDVVGALECAKLELYRRVVVPYEHRKRLENGDVYPAELLLAGADAVKS